MAWRSPIPRLLRLLPRAVRDRAARARVRVREAGLAGVTVNLAESGADLREAAALVHAAYVARGLLPPEPGGARLTPHLLLPTTMTFVARAAGRIVGTLSLFTDSVIGIPADPLAPTELERLRSRRRRVAEAGELAVAPAFRGVGLTYLLGKALYRCALELLRVDDLVVAVHPDAEDHYRAVLCFERLRPPQRVPGLAPRARAVVMRLDLRLARWTWFQCFGHLPSTAGNPYHMYIERRDPQIAPPPSVDATVAARRDGLSDLVAADPATVAAMPRHLEGRLLDLIGAAARVPGERVWEEAASWRRPLKATRDWRRPG
jgi:GNAT superfamily N-acetyltransferase